MLTSGVLVFCIHKVSNTSSFPCAPRRLGGGQCIIPGYPKVINKEVGNILSIKRTKWWSTSPNIVGGCQNFNLRSYVEASPIYIDAQSRRLLTWISVGHQNLKCEPLLVVDFTRYRLTGLMFEKRNILTAGRSRLNIKNWILAFGDSSWPSLVHFRSTLL